MKKATDQYTKLLAALKKLQDRERVRIYARFFKTGPGEYGEGDMFLGITVPLQRKVAKQFQDLQFADLQKLLKSNIHEHRFVALEILVMQYEKGNEKEKKKIVDFYLTNTSSINNWDLVDTSAPYILGDYLLSREKDILYRLANSSSLWERRIAIIATFACIKQNQFADTIKIAKFLVNDIHDLIHKAVGWMLREVGKRSETTLREFLDTHYKEMPRTMLRYAIEKFPEARRKQYLKKNFSK